jgi:hypothetical protein
MKLLVDIRRETTHAIANPFIRNAYEKSGGGCQERERSMLGRASVDDRFSGSTPKL